LEIISIPVPVKTGKFNLYQSFRMSGFEFKENDILVVSRKYISMSEGSLLNLSQVRSSEKAKVVSAA